MLAIRDSEASEEEEDEDDTDGTENGEGEKKGCQCQNHSKGQKEIVFLSKRVDSKQRVRGYVNLRGMDVPVPWLIWDEDDQHVVTFPTLINSQKNKILFQFLNITTELNRPPGARAHAASAPSGPCVPSRSSPASQ